MAKKYRYNVSLSANGEFFGTVDLTKEEADIVAFATNVENWENTCGSGWCGSFWIDTNNPEEIKD